MKSCDILSSRLERISARLVELNKCNIELKHLSGKQFLISDSFLKAQSATDILDDEIFQKSNTRIN